MRKSVLAAAAVAALVAAVPASAQVYYSNDPASGDGSENAAVPGYGANGGISFGYVPVGRPSHEQAVTTRGHVTSKSAGAKSASYGTGSDY
jgi:hypothetical protein